MEEEEEEQIDTSAILSAPRHDTGNIIYLILSLLLPVLGIIGALVFKKKNYIRNYKACKKGAIAGFCIIGIIVVLFLIFLLIAATL